MPGLSIFLQMRAARLLVFSSVSCSSVNLQVKNYKCKLLKGLSIFLQMRAARLLVFSSVSCTSVNLQVKNINASY